MGPQQPPQGLGEAATECNNFTRHCVEKGLVEEGLYFVGKSDLKHEEQPIAKTQ